MVRKIDEGWLIRLGGVLDLQLVLVGQSVSNGTIEGAWIIFFSIFTRVRQLEARSVAVSTFSACQTALSNPLRPPCRAFESLFCASWYSTPPIVNLRLQFAGGNQTGSVPPNHRRISGRSLWSRTRRCVRLEGRTDFHDL